MSDGDHMDGIDALVNDWIKGEPRNATEDEEVHHFWQTWGRCKAWAIFGLHWL